MAGGFVYPGARKLSKFVEAENIAVILYGDVDVEIIAARYITGAYGCIYYRKWLISFVEKLHGPAPSSARLLKLTRREMSWHYQS